MADEAGRETVFAQQGYRCKLEWGRRGARGAGKRGDILIVVDVLSFSSAVITAAARGAFVKPCLSEMEALLAAQTLGGEAAVKRENAPAPGRYSLSPLSFLDIPPQTRVFLPSPNGAACLSCALAHPKAQVFVGALLNARAVGQAVTQILAASNDAATVLACGERWQEVANDNEEAANGNADEGLRFALEDYLGAGAILSAIRQADVEQANSDSLTFSPEAQVCLGAFETARADLASVLWECGSGRELRGRGYASDVTHSAQLDAYTVVPRADADGFLRPFEASY